MAYNKGYGLCGIWVEITTTVTDTEVEIDVAGAPGNTQGTSHDWTKLEVLVQAKNAATGSWETKFDVSPTEQTWDGSFSKANYSAYKVNAKGYDEYETHRGRAIANVDELIVMEREGDE